MNFCNIKLKKFIFFIFRVSADNEIQLTPQMVSAEFAAIDVNCRTDEELKDIKRCVLFFLMLCSGCCLYVFYGLPMSKLHIQTICVQW